MFIWTVRTILVSGQISCWYVCFNQNSVFWESVTFGDDSENDVFSWRCILKSSPMLWTPRRGFCFWKISIPGISRHAHFEEIALLLIFGPSVSPFLEEVYLYGPSVSLNNLCAIVTLFIVYCVLCIVHCVLCIVYCVLCIVYCVLCTVYCVLCIVWSLGVIWDLASYVSSSCFMIPYPAPYMLIVLFFNLVHPVIQWARAGGRT